ncbi:MAG: Cytochrome c-type biogenesis protein CcmI [Candidatus Tokpelaia hoelldobleri]|uniref:Cytochrome c-type biogenesis protein CcmI n=1 Tax=Candidatus Tokpelaia hoelldobleri TaxID=1902579 RepID=A0A1U9JW12_9HYPH|nr:MAG: Cytochrome c-type biogenesis protein CcmI [Candidatus Tokpelaia hoelldoblerii]
MVLLLAQLLVMILVVAFVLKWVTGAPQEVLHDERQAALGFYAHALDELANTEKQGLLSKANASEARLELTRQMLGAEQAATVQIARGHGRRSDKKRMGLLFAVLLIPLVSWGLYALLGSPQLPQRSFAAWEQRNPASLNSAEILVRLEVEAYRSPRDGALMERLGNAYMAAGLFQDAVNSYGRARGLQGDNARLLVLYSMALAGYEGGVVNEEAEHNLRRALELEPDNVPAVTGLAAAIEQNGRTREAAGLLQKFLRNFPDTAAHGTISARIAALQQAAERQAQQRVIRENINKFVANTESRPQDVKAWQMLVTAWLVLEKPEEARAALVKAMQVLPEADARGLAVFAKARGLFPRLEESTNDQPD